MATAAASDSFTFFNNEELSDIKIKFGDQEVFAHRYVLCRNSAYFRKMLMGKFAEKGKAVIELHDDHSPAVLAMLRHMYDLPYMPKDQDAAENRAVLPHAQIYAVAEKYGIADLKEAVHARLFGEESSMLPYWMLFCEDIAHAIRLIFNNTPTTDKLMRPPLVRLIAAGLKFLSSEESQDAFRRLLTDIPDLAIEVVLHVGQTRGDSMKIYTCPHCDHRRTEESCINAFNAALQSCPRCRMADAKETILDEANWEMYQANTDAPCDVTDAMVKRMGLTGEYY